jgi:large subunit ribosomal protein L18
MSKRTSRIRRGMKAKALQRNSDRPRLVVYRSACNIYSQIVVGSEKGDVVLVSCSTLDTELKASLSGNKVEQASQVGKLLGERAKAKEILDVAFDRSGYRYHGRVKALADGARAAGLNF